MPERPIRVRPGVPALAGWLLTVGALVATLLLDARLRATGDDQATHVSVGTLGLIMAMASSATVGALVAVRRPRHPVGWLFLGLGLAIALSGALDAYASYGVLARPGSLPAADVVAVLGGASFIPWLVLLTLLLLLTPTGRPPSARWGRLVPVVLGSGVALLLASCLSTAPLDPPFDHVKNPMGLDGVSAVVDVLRGVAALTLVASVVAGAVSLVIRFRVAEGEERRRLRWVTWAATTVPFLVVGTAAAATSGHPVILNLLAGALVSLFPIAAGLAVTRYRLYDVDRVLSRTVTYLLVTSVVAACYAVVVVVTGGVLGRAAGRSPTAAVVGTLVAISAAGPVRRRLQDPIDRRFNRRQFDAVRVVRDYVQDPHPELSVEDVLRQATGDDSLGAAYWIEDRARWVTGDGRVADVGKGGIAVRRRDAPVACVTYDAARVEPQVVEAAVAEARPELENARLLAALQLQLVEVRASRARIVSAQLEERRRIERDLHDGAQQRLLALALNLRAAEVSGDAGRAPGALDTAVEELQRAVRELRDLANGLHPVTLVDGGLAGALEELAGRTPDLVRLAVLDERYEADVEATAWYVACEAVANAIKHARPTSIEVTTRRRDGMLVLEVADDGAGGADPSGSGLRGLADRAEAIGGRFAVRARPGGGTVVEAELPCGW